MSTGGGDWWVPAIVLGGAIAALGAGLAAAFARSASRSTRYTLAAVAFMALLLALWGLSIVLNTGA